MRRAKRGARDDGRGTDAIGEASERASERLTDGRRAKRRCDRSTTLMRAKRKYAKTDAVHCPMTAKIVEAMGDEACVTVRANATLPAAATNASTGMIQGSADAMEDGEDDVGRSRGGEVARAIAAPQSVMTTTELVTSIDGEALVADFVRAAEDLCDRIELDDEDASAGDDMDDASGAVMLSELRDFSSRCELLRERGLLKGVGKRDLVKTLSMLERVAKSANETLIAANAQYRGADAQRVLKSLEAIGAYFVILAATDMPKEIYREEGIDEMIECARQHLVRNVFVFYDAGMWNVHRGSDEDGDDVEQDGKKKTPASKSKGVSAPPPPSSSKKSGSGGYKVAKMLGAKIGVIFTHLANLISLLALPDATVLQLTSLAFSAFEIEDVSFVQLKSVELVSSIFTQYSEHRGFVVDNILSSLMKLPTEGRSVRCFNVPGEDSVQIQVLLALLMQCLQATVEFSDDEATMPKADKEGEMTTDVHARAFGSAFYWTNYFWKDLLTRWPKVKAAEHERQIRAVIHNALVDALTCRNLPEWPVANLLVLNLAGNLLGSAGLQCKDSKIREIALDFLGQIASKLRADSKAVEEDAFWRELPRAEDLEFTSNAETLHEKAVMFAHQDAARVRTRVDAQTESALVQADEASADIFAMESIIARYLAENNRGPSSTTFTRDDDADEDDENGAAPREGARMSDDTASHSRVTLNTSAVSYHLCQFARDAERAGVGFRQEVVAGGSRAMYAALHASMVRVADTAKKATNGSLAGLPRELAKSLCLQLNARRPLARQLDVLVQRVTAMLDDASVLVRTSATRAIGGIVNEDPKLLESPDIVRALKIRLKDTGSSVRAAVVDVIGRQMVRNVSLAEKYYDLIEDRVSDVGVSVRKRVVSTLQECLRNPDFTKADKAMQVLAFRILDEEETIRSHVVKIFRELWFSPVALEDEADDEHDDDEDDGDGNNGSDDEDASTAHLATVGHDGIEDNDPIAIRARQMVSVAWGVYRLVSRSGKQKLPLLPTFPVVAIISAVLYPSEDEKVDAWVNVRGMRKVAKRLSVQVLHALIESESDEQSRAPNGERVKSNGAHNGVVVKDEPGTSKSVPMSVKYALGLHILTVVDPCLCLPKRDPSYFAVALQPYLKRVDDDAPFVGEKLQCCMSVVHIVAKHAGRLPAPIAKEIERDLRILLLRHHDKAVIYYACKTLCAVAETRGGKDSGTMSMLKRFVAIVIESISSDEALSVQNKSHCARSLYVLGNIARFGADVVDAAVENGECDISIQDLLRVFRKTLESQPAEEYDLTRGALGACGDLFVARPELMFNRDGGFGKGSFDSIMRAALASSAERGLKEQALTNLSELIREEEFRMTATSGSAAANEVNASTKASVLKSAQKRSRDAEKLQVVNGQSDRSIAGGIAQRYWTDVLALCVDSAYSVRLKGLHLVEVVLRQGLVHPASAFPTLIALQIDPVPSVKRLARKLLKAQVQRHGDFFEHQLTHGVELAYSFKKRLETAARRSESGQKKIADASDGFAFVYSLVNSSRTSRNAFLNTLLRRFETTSGSSDALFLRFLASVVTELPFTSVDETLYVVFQLNRVISLKGGLLLEQLTKGVEASAAKADDAVPDNEFKSDVELACALSVVLLLKSHVKKAYELSDARVASYVPTEATRNAEVVKFDDTVKFETGIVDATAGQSYGSARRAVDTFRDLMTRDASDFAEDMFKETATKRGRKRATKTQADADADAEATPGTPASRRRRRAAVVVDDDDDEEEDEDDDQDENDEDASLPGLRSAGVTTSKKRAVNSAQKAAKPASKKRLKF